MKIQKILSIIILGFIAFVGVHVNAEAVPVSCSWSVISSYGPPDNSWRDIVRECKETDGTLVATQTFRGYSNGNVENCSILPEDGITYTGACMTAEFFREELNGGGNGGGNSSQCTTPGMRVQGGCANSYDSSMLTDPVILGRCGSGCSLRFETLGWTEACPFVGHNRSPEYGLFCK
ncbi:hypothetical protein [Marinimicrobium sp. ARAG 43.8]|uniref:hypothetical protein n=1 Tax=Marinimicrobium sp. ARAG 43.8 TaxID=3418719 RepID=UPI003CFA2603